MSIDYGGGDHPHEALWDAIIAECAKIERAYDSWASKAGSTQSFRQVDIDQLIETAIRFTYRMAYDRGYSDAQ